MIFIRKEELNVKKYLKPELNNFVVTIRENISSQSGLTDWLQSSAGSDYKDAGITTYVLNS